MPILRTPTEALNRIVGDDNTTYRKFRGARVKGIDFSGVEYEVAKDSSIGATNTWLNNIDGHFENSNGLRDKIRGIVPLFTDFTAENKGNVSFKAQTSNAELISFSGDGDKDIVQRLFSDLDLTHFHRISLSCRNRMENSSILVDFYRYNPLTSVYDIFETYRIGCGSLTLGDVDNFHSPQYVNAPVAGWEGHDKRFGFVRVTKEGTDTNDFDITIILDHTPYQYFV